MSGIDEELKALIEKIRDLERKTRDRDAPREEHQELAWSRARVKEIEDKARDDAYTDFYAKPLTPENDPTQIAYRKLFSDEQEAKRKRLEQGSNYETIDPDAIEQHFKDFYEKK